MKAMPLTLVMGNKAYSSWSLRPWLALKQTGAAFDEIVIPLDKADSEARIRAHSSSGRVPVLRHGEHVVWDSISICEYLHELFPAAGLWPEDPLARAVARSVSAEMHAGFAALRDQLSMKLKPDHIPATPRPDTRRDIARIIEVWQDCRARFGRPGPFLFGGFSIADAMYAPVVCRFRVYGVPLEGVAHEYAEAVWSHPPMKEWVAAAKAEPFVAEKHDAEQP
jgi:glutathione S-transferase